jgi:hypothetical protein
MIEPLKTALKWANLEDRIKKLEDLLKQQSDQINELKNKFQPVKYCECCPVPERQPLIRSGGTTKRSMYFCPKTKQNYYVNFP